MGEKAFKPSIPFLEKVEAGAVRRTFRYSKKGGKHRFIGGQKTAKMHQSAGYIEMRGWADLGVPDVARLTPAGVFALSTHRAALAEKEG